MGVTVLVFAVELQKVRTDCIASNSWEDWGEFQNEIYVEGGRKHWNIFFFYRIYIDISQLGGNVIEMALKWNLKWFNTALTPTMRISVRIMNSATHVPLTLRTFPTHWVYLGQKQPQLRSPITFSSWFLFDELHFMNNVSSGPFFTGAILLYPVRDAQCNTNPGYAWGGGVHGYTSNWTMQ